MGVQTLSAKQQVWSTDYLTGYSLMQLITSLVMPGLPLTSKCFFQGCFHRGCYSPAFLLVPVHRHDSSLI